MNGSEFASNMFRFRRLILTLLSIGINDIMNDLSFGGVHIKSFGIHVNRSFVRNSYKIARNSHYFRRNQWESVGMRGNPLQLVLRFVWNGGAVILSASSFKLSLQPSSRSIPSHLPRRPLRPGLAFKSSLHRSSAIRRAERTSILILR